VTPNIPGFAFGYAEARSWGLTYQLILWRIFHFWWRFLLPILRLRLGFAILFSVNRTKTSIKIILFVILEV
jgi:hypothetical protein